MQPIRKFSIAAMLLAAAACAGTPVETPAKGVSFEMTDQYGHRHACAFPALRITVLALADREGSGQLSGWIQPLSRRYGEALDIRGIARLDQVPRVVHGLVRALFRARAHYPILLDWSGRVSAAYGGAPRIANLVLLDRDGTIVHRASGPATDEGLDALFRQIDGLHAESPSPAPPEQDVEQAQANPDRAGKPHPLPEGDHGEE